MVYSAMDFDSFTDPFGANVSLGSGDSLKGRLGLALDKEEAWKDLQDHTTSRYPRLRHREFILRVSRRHDGRRFGNRAGQRQRPAMGRHRTRRQLQLA